MAPFRAQGVEQHERAPHDTHEVVYMGAGQSKAGQREAEGVVLSRIMFENARTHEMGDAS